MRASSVVTSVLLAACLNGCSVGGEPPVAPPQEGTAYTELPQQKTTVSGIVFDPEAFFFAMATFPPPPPDDPEAPPPPPPLLSNGIAYLTRSVPVGARVSVVDGNTVADSSGPATAGGFWQVRGVPTNAELEYRLRAEPPAEGVVIGAPEMFPSPSFEPIPAAKYHPTTSLSSVRTLNTYCASTVAVMVGEAGALSALAEFISSSGTPTTVEDLLNPAKTGGVVLVWVHAPSFFFDFFNIPTDGIAVEASHGKVYTLGWAPPGSFPGQSPLGYFVMPEGLSPLGYYAVVLPPGSSEPLSLGLTDTVTSPEGEDPGPFGPRPWPLAGLTAQVRPGVSFFRTFAFPSFAPPPPDPNEEFVPPTDMSWTCR